MSELLPVVIDQLLDQVVAEEKKHVSYSEIASWIGCSYFHKLKYIDQKGLDLFSQNEFTEFGHVLHEAVQDYLRTKNPPSISETRKKLSDALAAENVKIKTGGYEEGEWLDAVEPILTDIPLFFDKEFSNWECLGTEVPLYEPIEIEGFTTNKNFKGFIDLVIKVPKSSRLKRAKPDEYYYWILDFKTASWGWTPEKKQDFNKILQLVLYKHFWCKKNNIPLNDVRCGFVLLKRVISEGSRKKNNTASCELVQISVGDKAIQRGLEIVRTMLVTSKKKFCLKNRDHCSWCEYFGTRYCSG